MEVSHHLYSLDWFPPRRIYYTETTTWLTCNWDGLLITSVSLLSDRKRCCWAAVLWFAAGSLVPNRFVDYNFGVVLMPTQSKGAAGGKREKKKSRGAWHMKVFCWWRGWWPYKSRHLERKFQRIEMTRFPFFRCVYATLLLIYSMKQSMLDDGKESLAWLVCESISAITIYPRHDDEWEGTEKFFYFFLFFFKRHSVVQLDAN